jgi:hypothetical protein
VRNGRNIRKKENRNKKERGRDRKEASIEENIKAKHCAFPVPANTCNS